MTDTDFVQPTLDPVPGAEGGAVLETTAAPLAVTNDGKTDELSLAVAADSQRNAIHLPEPVALPGKYQLEYVLEGKAIKETHIDVEHAVARVRALRVLGIIPVTSTL